eukprot:CAMPEP_0194148286 /NCGR_PEP_ID=MMETSP0152-20130528/31373_1 /TAXON_ID=1049557 /ORGANISM="Thalassiothrix antarctica, Strain L6-D1" /LENGTH=255 /DNA_ID=CAMNT_0038849699 /DNA_START=101 /DNA_END=868 /DNA_ORIENTATION=+
MSSDDVGLKDVGQQQQSNKKNNNIFNPSTTRTDKLSSWRSHIDLSIKRSRKIRGSNYVQIATTASNGEPRCRTVVFRGFQEFPNDHPISVTAAISESDSTSCVMKMITDNRSNKVSEVKAASNNNSTAEIVWWFPKSSEQYRIRGKLLFVGNGQFELDNDESLMNARKQQWGNLRDAAREQFFWNEPGAAFEGEPNVPAGGRDKEGALIPAPDTFLLMFLLPERVDYLCLTDNYHQVDELAADKKTSWEMKRVNP